VRTLSRRDKGLLGLVALTAVVLAVLRLNNPAGAPAARARGDEPLPSPVPRIDLARLSAAHPDTTAGRRDLFQFGSARDANAEAVPEAVQPTPTPAPVETVYVPTPPPGPPPLKVFYLGSVESRAGVKVAVLMTDRKEVLTAQAGELVANRYRIARIGLESVDLEDVGSGQSRRIPLRGN